MVENLDHITKQDQKDFQQNVFSFPFAVNTEEVEYKSIVNKESEIHEIHFAPFNWQNILIVNVVARLEKFIQTQEFKTSLEFNIEPIDRSMKIVSSLLPLNGFIIGDNSPGESSTQGHASLTVSMNTLLINFSVIWENGFRAESQKYASFCHKLDEFCLQMTGN